MKKVFSLLFSFIIILSLSIITVSAKTVKFTDTVEDGFPKAHSWSEKMCYQYNEDLECSTLVKQSDTGSPSTTEYIVYRMDSDITGFSLDCMHVNGLGDGITDIKVFVSADCATWNEVAVKATEQVFDDEIYIDYDHAYWVSSTVSNKVDVPQGCQFIKIQIQPFTVPESCTWNTVIDTVNIMCETDDTGVDDTVNDDSNTDKDIENSENIGSSQNDDSDSNNDTLIIICVVCAAAVIIAVVFAVVFLKTKNNTVVKKDKE